MNALLSDVMTLHMRMLAVDIYLDVVESSLNDSLLPSLCSISILPLVHLGNLHVLLRDLWVSNFSRKFMRVAVMLLHLVRANMNVSLDAAGGGSICRSEGISSKHLGAHSQCFIIAW